MLKMYVFGENDDVITWVAAETQGQAIDLYENITGDEIAHWFNDLNEYAREMDPNEMMTYYHDGKTPEKDTIQNLINKYCDTPDIFATSEF